MERTMVLKRIARDDLDDDVLGLILERVGSQVSLIRAASTCKRWRRIIADAAFLHGTTVAGNYHNPPTLPLLFEKEDEARKRKGPVFVPSPSLSVDGRHHSLDFLQGSANEWTIVDSRGGLLLMCRVKPSTNFLDFSDMVVCEPLTQRYKKIPAPPVSSRTDGYISGRYLVDGDVDESGGRIGMSNFRVFFDVCRSFYPIPQAITVFDFVGSSRGSSSSSSWSKKTMDHVVPRHFLRRDYSATPDNPGPGHELGTVAGSRYIYLKGGTLVSLDCSTGEFSLSQLPTAKYSRDLQSWPFSFHAVEGRDGEPRLITLFFHDIRVYARIGGNWEPEKSLQLGEITFDLPGYQPLSVNDLQSLKLFDQRSRVCRPVPAPTIWWCAVFLLSQP